MLGSTIKDRCKQCDCGEQRVIVNKKHYLCQQKNQQRLHKNKTQDKKTVANTLINKTSLSSKGKLKLSSKKNNQNKRYRDVCNDIIQRRGSRCQGCNTSERLSFSHLIPRSKRPDLIDNPKNIHIHCMDGDNVQGCHSKCEAGKYEELLDGQQIIQAIKQLDQQYYQLKKMKNEFTS